MEKRYRNKIIIIIIIIIDYSEKTQTEVVRARHTIIWTGQDHPTGNSSRRKTKRQTEETMGRQHQRVDWPSMEHRTTES